MFKSRTVFCVACAFAIVLGFVISVPAPPVPGMGFFVRTRPVVSGNVVVFDGTSGFFGLDGGGSLAGGSNAWVWVQANSNAIYWLDGRYDLLADMGFGGFDADDIGDAYVTNNVYVTNDVDIGGDADIEGDVDIESDLGVVGDAAFGTNVNVAGGLVISNSPTASVGPRYFWMRESDGELRLSTLTIETADRTISVASGESVQTDAIDTIGDIVPAGVVITIEIDDAVYSETWALADIGGSGEIYLTSTNVDTTLHLDQMVTNNVLALGVNGHGLTVTRVEPIVYIRDIAFITNSTNNNHGIQSSGHKTVIDVRGCKVLGNGVANGSGIHGIAGTRAFVQNCYFSNLKQAIYSHALVWMRVRDCDDTGTLPATAYAAVAGFIQIRGTALNATATNGTSNAGLIVNGVGAVLP